MAEETPTTASTPGSPEGTGSQGSENTGQPGAQTQVVESTKVEDGSQSASNSGADGGQSKTSNYFEQRRKAEQRERTYQSTIAEQKRMIERMEGLIKTLQPPAAPSPASKSKTEELLRSKAFWEKPQDVILDTLKSLKEEVREELLREMREKELPNFIGRSNEMTQKQRSESEALDLLFPKSSPTDKAALPDRMDGDPERKERIFGILMENNQALNRFSDIDPQAAASMVLEIYDKRYPKTQNRSKDLPSKGAMGSTASGTPPGGAKMPTQTELKEKTDSFKKQISENPQLLQDDAFMGQYKAHEQAVERFLRDAGKAA